MSVEEAATGPRTRCVAFALDVSKSMDCGLEFLGRRVDVAKRLLLRVMLFLLEKIGSYRLHLYLFPSGAPDLLPHERIYHGLVVDVHSIAKLERLLGGVVETRPTTPLIEALERIAMEVESRCAIVAVTDGEMAHPIFSGTGRAPELARVLDEKGINALVVALSTRPRSLEALVSTTRRVMLEVLRPTLLHSGVIDDTARQLSGMVASLILGGP